MLLPGSWKDCRSLGHVQFQGSKMAFFYEPESRGYLDIEEKDVCLLVYIRPLANPGELLSLL